MAHHPIALRDSVAVSVGRTAGYWSRRRGHGGSSLPGLIAERIAPGVSSRIASQMDAIAVVSGTNGKTTTTHLLDHILEASGRTVVTNRSGANLSQSISTTVLEGAGDVAKTNRVTAVLECDEFALADQTGQLLPNVVVLTNLFRDQLDRYTEIDEIERRWAKLLDRLPNTTVIAPADDPRLAWLATHAPGGCLLYGLRSGSGQKDEMGLTHDSEDCPRCGYQLDYEWHSIGQLGSYNCPMCSYERPSRWLDIEIVESRGFDGQTVCMRLDGSPAGVTLLTSLPGTANAYNLAAAVCAAFVLGVEPAQAIQSLAAVSNAWGRFETALIDGRRLILTLGKNPASVAELLRIASASDISGVLFVMNDGFQDGRDVSWYWDVNPAVIANGKPCAITGARALDFAVRLKYEQGGPLAQDSQRSAMTFADPMSGLRWLVEETAPGATLLAISTYTGLVQLRESLVARRLLERMPV
jgi:UDP-N-acetylmuramyl tripeptide synthase